MYSLEPLPWAPGSADWVKEVLAVDGYEPWRNCWVDVLAAHPYNTSFAPCNPKAPLFVPTGFNFQQVASAVKVDSSLDPCDVTAQWVQDYTEYHGPRPVVEEEEEDDGALSEGDLSDVSAACGSPKAAGSKHSSPSRTPPVQSDDGGAGAEEADDSVGSAAEDEESPGESSGKPHGLQFASTSWPRWPRRPSSAGAELLLRLHAHVVRIASCFSRYIVTSISVA
ncbi:hypothetical protein PR003_g16144 [Phytophthora rubi]|uniref:Uncharacterized protein n=1 Tax=Phytophthora rubi TaxID=129364 RepID=A0A6A3MX63_9STRA|nr:hypothetical protein PR001_g16103 [Phytophthora rubi]KAE9033785.1 hypothetical protein PR002_g8488 [Phytophthora rubi]KAE9326901.1 hypothetical protein PR003_g16144 [Phytophthora rubi]